MAGFSGTKPPKLPNVAAPGSVKSPMLTAAKPAKLPGSSPDMPSMQGSTKPAKPPRMPGIKGNVGRKLGNHYSNT